MADSQFASRIEGNGYDEQISRSASLLPRESRRQIAGVRSLYECYSGSGVIIE